MGAHDDDSYVWEAWAVPGLKPSAQKVLDLLRVAGPLGVTTGEFVRAYCLSYSQRIGELKRLRGVVVNSVRIRGTSQNLYTLVEPR